MNKIKLLQNKKFHSKINKSWFACFFQIDERIFRYPMHLLFHRTGLRVQCVVVQSPSCVRLFENPCIAAHQASLSFNTWRWPKFMSIALVIPSNHLILWCPLLCLPSIFPSIRDFYNESAVHIRWPKCWSFNFSISSSNKYSGLNSLKID